MSKRSRRLQLVPTSKVRPVPPVLKEFSAVLADLAPRYARGDQTALLDGLLHLQTAVLSRRDADTTDWFVSALRTLVLKSLEDEPAGRRRNLRLKLESLSEDYARYALVMRRVDGKGLSWNVAYREAAIEREKQTGLSVSAGAIRQSVRRVEAGENVDPQAMSLQLSKIAEMLSASRSKGM